MRKRACLQYKTFVWRKQRKFDITGISYLAKVFVFVFKELNLKYFMCPNILNNLGNIYIKIAFFGIILLLLEVLNVFSC